MYPTRPPLHKRIDSLQSTTETSLLNTSSPSNVSSFMMRKVSWDPAITEPKPRQSSRPISRDHARVRRPESPLLHPLLTPEANTLFDARLPPATALPSAMVSEPATMSGARHLRLISREFPWTLEISNPKQNPVTCADVFNAIYGGLSVPLTASEWTLADDSKKDSLMRANRNRRGGNVRRLRRIDWLGSKIYFKGLTKDDILGRARLLPEDELWPDTWVVKFSSH